MPSPVRVALAGNPNAGKTTLFNALTGSRQHVGNYPGITVDKKEGIARASGCELHITDLPGTYSLTAFTQEELVARHVILDEKPDVAVDVVNASVLERNLYLAVQLMEIGIPVVLVLNMMDEVKRHGIVIDAERLSELLGIPVVEAVARSGKGADEVVRRTSAYAAEKKGEWKPLEISYGPDLDEAIAELTALIADNSFLNKYPARWVAIKYLEGDEEILELGRKEGPLAGQLEAIVEKVARHCEQTLKTYPEAIIADYRYGFISSLLKQGVVKVSPQERVARSDRMDTVLTHKFLGPLIMLSILYGIYQFTFAVGDIPVTWMGDFFAWLGDTVGGLLPEGQLKSLLVSGVIDGVGGVLSFVPLIAIIFFIIAFLEDSGYMARIAYMLDRVFRIFGLHGCSVMPFIVSGGIAGGCAVPGVMAARTLRSPKEKLATILTAPFMTCGAKLPVFILLVSVFFPKEQALAMFLVTLGGWAFALIVARILRTTLISGPSTPFVMELPPYRLPTLRGMLIHTWERTWQYIKKAATVILAISVLLWAAMTYPGLSGEQQAAFDVQKQRIEAALEQAETEGMSGELAAQLEQVEAAESLAELRHSFAGQIGTKLESVTKAAGFDWRLNIALLGGVAAKEIIVSTLGTAYSLGDVEAEEGRALTERIKADPSWTTAKGISVMLFIMLYAPCFVTVVTIRQEAGSWKWAAFSVLFNTAFAFGVATAAFQLGALF